jgi:hypothetical protein
VHLPIDESHLYFRKKKMEPHFQQRRVRAFRRGRLEKCKKHKKQLAAAMEVE